MDDKRQHHRISCVSKCLLYHASTKYSGVILNISLTGAAVKLQGMQPGAFRLGDACDLILSTKPDESFCTYKGRIIRISLREIGLEFE